MSELDYIQKQQAMSRLSGSIEIKKPGLIENTKNDIERLESQLAIKKELLDLLQSEPKMQRVLELLMNGSY